MDSGWGYGGASAKREYERRRNRVEQRIRDARDWFGGIAVALSDERQSTTVWARGAVGEERVGAALDRIACGSMMVLHDRQIPGSRANLDHLVVTSNTVWVVDAKRYKGRPARRVEGGILRPRTEILTVGGRNRSKLIAGVTRQRDLVAAVLLDVPVVSALCFVDADWPLIGGNFTIGGVRASWPNRLVKTITTTGAGGVDVEAVTARLVAHFRTA